MNDSLDHEDPIEEAAADWLALRAEGFSSAQKREFARWCRADPRHAAAVAVAAYRRRIISSRIVLNPHYSSTPFTLCHLYSMLCL